MPTLDLELKFFIKNAYQKKIGDQVDLPSVVYQDLQTDLHNSAEYQKAESSQIVDQVVSQHVEESYAAFNAAYVKALDNIFSEKPEQAVSLGLPRYARYSLQFFEGKGNARDHAGLDHFFESRVIDSYVKVKNPYQELLASHDGNSKPLPLYTFLALESEYRETKQQIPLDEFIAGKIISEHADFRLAKENISFSTYLDLAEERNKKNIMLGFKLSIDDFLKEKKQSEIKEETLQSINDETTATRSLLTDKKVDPQDTNDSQQFSSSVNASSLSSENLATQNQNQSIVWDQFEPLSPTTEASHRKSGSSTTSDEEQSSALSSPFLRGRDTFLSDTDPSSAPSVGLSPRESGEFSPRYSGEFDEKWNNYAARELLGLSLPSESEVESSHNNLTTASDEISPNAKNQVDDQKDKPSREEDLRQKATLEEEIKELRAVIEDAERKDSLFLISLERLKKKLDEASKPLQTTQNLDGPQLKKPVSAFVGEVPENDSIVADEALKYLNFVRSSEVIDAYSEKLTAYNAQLIQYEKDAIDEIGNLRSRINKLIVKPVEKTNIFYPSFVKESEKIYRDIDVLNNNLIWLADRKERVQTAQNVLTNQRQNSGLPAETDLSIETDTIPEIEAIEHDAFFARRAKLEQLVAPDMVKYLQAVDSYESVSAYKNLLDEYHDALSSQRSFLEYKNELLENRKKQFEADFSTSNLSSNFIEPEWIAKIRTRQKIEITAQQKLMDNEDAALRQAMQKWREVDFVVENTFLRVENKSVHANFQKLEQLIAPEMLEYLEVVDSHENISAYKYLFNQYVDVSNDQYQDILKDQRWLLSQKKELLENRKKQFEIDFPSINLHPNANEPEWIVGIRNQHQSEIQTQEKIIADEEAKLDQATQRVLRANVLVENAILRIDNPKKPEFPQLSDDISMPLSPIKRKSTYKLMRSGTLSSILSRKSKPNTSEDLMARGTKVVAQLEINLDAHDSFVPDMVAKGTRFVAQLERELEALDTQTEKKIEEVKQELRISDFPVIWEAKSQPISAIGTAIKRKLTGDSKITDPQFREIPHDVEFTGKVFDVDGNSIAFLVNLEGQEKIVKVDLRQIAGLEKVENGQTLKLTVKNKDIQARPLQLSMLKSTELELLTEGEENEFERYRNAPIGVEFTGKVFEIDEKRNNAVFSVILDGQEKYVKVDLNKTTSLGNVIVGNTLKISIPDENGLVKPLQLSMLMPSWMRLPIDEKKKEVEQVSPPLTPNFVENPSPIFFEPNEIGSPTNEKSDSLLSEQLEEEKRDFEHLSSQLKPTFIEGNSVIFTAPDAIPSFPEVEPDLSVSSYRQLINRSSSPIPQRPNSYRKEKFNAKTNLEKSKLVSVVEEPGLFIDKKNSYLNKTDSLQGEVSTKLPVINSQLKSIQNDIRTRDTSFNQHKEEKYPISELRVDEESLEMQAKIIEKLQKKIDRSTEAYEISIKYRDAIRELGEQQSQLGVGKGDASILKNLQSEVIKLSGHYLEHPISQKSYESAVRELAKRKDQLELGKQKFSVENRRFGFSDGLDVIDVDINMLLEKGENLSRAEAHFRAQDSYPNKVMAAESFNKTVEDFEVARNELKIDISNRMEQLQIDLVDLRKFRAAVIKQSETFEAQVTKLDAENKLSEESANLTIKLQVVLENEFHPSFTHAEYVDVMQSHKAKVDSINNDIASLISDLKNLEKISKPNYEDRNRPAYLKAIADYNDAQLSINAQKKLLQDKETLLEEEKKRFQEKIGRKVRAPEKLEQIVRFFQTCETTQREIHDRLHSFANFRDDFQQHIQNSQQLILQTEEKLKKIKEQDRRLELPIDLPKRQSIEELSKDKSLKNRPRKKLKKLQTESSQSTSSFKDLKTKLRLGLPKRKDKSKPSDEPIEVPQVELRRQLSKTDSLVSTTSDRSNISSASDISNTLSLAAPSVSSAYSEISNQLTFEDPYVHELLSPSQSHERERTQVEIVSSLDEEEKQRLKTELKIRNYYFPKSEIKDPASLLGIRDGIAGEIVGGFERIYTSFATNQTFLLDPNSSDVPILVTMNKGQADKLKIVDGTANKIAASETIPDAHLEALKVAQYLEQSPNLSGLKIQQEIGVDESGNTIAAFSAYARDEWTGLKIYGPKVNFRLLPQQKLSHAQLLILMDQAAEAWGKRNNHLIENMQVEELIRKRVNNPFEKDISERQRGSSDILSTLDEMELLKLKEKLKAWCAIPELKGKLNPPKDLINGIRDVRGGENMERTVEIFRSNKTNQSVFLKLTFSNKPGLIVVPTSLAKELKIGGELRSVLNEIADANDITEDPRLSAVKARIVDKNQRVSNTVIEAHDITEDVKHSPSFTELRVEESVDRNKDNKSATYTFTAYTENKRTGERINGDPISFRVLPQEGQLTLSFENFSRLQDQAKISWKTKHGHLVENIRVKRAGMVEEAYKISDAVRKSFLFDSFKVEQKIKVADDQKSAVYFFTAVAENRRTKEKIYGLPVRVRVLSTSSQKNLLLKEKFPLPDNHGDLTTQAKISWGATHGHLVGISPVNSALERNNSKSSTNSSTLSSSHSDRTKVVSTDATSNSSSSATESHKSVTDRLKERFGRKRR